MDFASLCSIADYYNVPTDFLLGKGEVNPATFATDEIEIIEKYRQLDGRGKNAVKAALESEFAYIMRDGAVKKTAM
jgi:hypothetical protein